MHFSNKYKSDIKTIIAKRYSNGGDYVLSYYNKAKRDKLYANSCRQRRHIRKKALERRSNNYVRNIS